LRTANAITIYDNRSGSTETIAKAIEKGREKTGVESISKGTANAKAEDPKDIDGQPTA
jgi:flavodoxin